MEKIAVFGKGGIGKSTIVANMSVLYALQGRKVLQVGCDPKHDSTFGLIPGGYLETFMEKVIKKSEGLRSNWTADEVLVRGRLGIDCVEAGGPEPGVGCAGRGISLMLDIFLETNILKTRSYDVVIFDVLGDVVCGGFAAPLRKGHAEKVLIVISEELMALYAANNIAKAILNYGANGIYLAGLVANVRDSESDLKRLEQFARLLNTKILEVIPREPAVREAEFAGVQTAVEHAPKSVFRRRLESLAGKVLALRREDCPTPTPLDDRRFYATWRGNGAGKSEGV